MKTEPLKGKKILIVDDEDFLREVLSEIFADSGAITKSAENGTKAFEILQVEKFDAVISDIRMPGGDGLSLIENISTQLEEKPKVFLCSGFNDISPEKAKKFEVVEIFSKPFNNEKLVNTVARVLTLDH